MANVEGWTIYVATDSEGDRIPVRQPDQVEAERHGLEAVEVVPADAYREAVYALEMVQRLIAIPAEAILDDAERVRRIKLVVDTFLHSVPGYSTP